MLSIFTNPKIAVLIFVQQLKEVLGTSYKILEWVLVGIVNWFKTDKAFKYSNFALFVITTVSIFRMLVNSNPGSSMHFEISDLSYIITYFSIVLLLMNSWLYYMVSIEPYLHINRIYENKNLMFFENHGDFARYLSMNPKVEEENEELVEEAFNDFYFFENNSILLTK